MSNCLLHNSRTTEATATFINSSFSCFRKKVLSFNYNRITLGSEVYGDKIIQAKSSKLRKRIHSNPFFGVISFKQRSHCSEHPPPCTVVLAALFMANGTSMEDVALRSLFETDNYKERIIGWSPWLHMPKCVDHITQSSSVGVGRLKRVQEVAADYKCKRNFSRCHLEKVARRKLAKSFNWNAVTSHTNEIMLTSLKDMSIPMRGMQVI